MGFSFSNGARMPNNGRLVFLLRCSWPYQSELSFAGSSEEDQGNLAQKGVEEVKWYEQCPKASTDYWLLMDWILYHDMDPMGMYII